MRPCSCNGAASVAPVWLQVTGSQKEAAAVESQMKTIARPMYSNPPLHGALLVTKILQDPALKNLWYDVSAPPVRCLLPLGKLCCPRAVDLHSH